MIRVCPCLWRMIGWMILGIISWSCRERTLTVEVPSQPPRLVVNSLFHPGQQQWRIYMGISRAVIGPVTDTLRRPTVHYTLYENDTAFVEGILPADSEYIQIAYPQPKAGHTYRIVATANDYPSVEAESTVPYAVSVRAQIRSTDTSQPHHWAISWDDLPNADYYWFYPSVRIYYSSSLPQITYSEFYYVKGNVPPPPSEFDGMDPNGSSQNWVEQMVFSDATFTDSSAYLEVMLDSTWVAGCRTPGVDSCFLEFHVITLSKAAYWYVQSILADNNQTGDFFSAPVQIYSNVRNGMGVWGGFYRSKTVIRQR